MTARIEFIKNNEELTIPLIKLTKSRNGKTGTATFLFLEPTIFKIFNDLKTPINCLYLIWDDKKIITRDMSLIFKNGVPYLIKVIFIFKNPKEWFDFLSFMRAYSRETGLTFSDFNSDL